MAQWLRLQATNAGATSSIPGQGTKIPHATRHGKNIKKKKKKKRQCLTVREDPVNGGISGSSEEGILRQKGFAVTLRSLYR